MLRIPLIVVICMMATVPRVAAQSNSTSTSELPWCTKNPAQPMLGHSVQIAENRLHIVLASKQPDAKRRLLKDAFVKLDEGQATQLVTNPAELSAGGNYYLVRASAYYLTENYTSVTRLVAHVFLEQKALEVINTSLSHPDAIPKNFAIVVETDAEIQRAEIICLTAW
jgi:hypothetical protein